MRVRKGTKAPRHKATTPKGQRQNGSDDGSNHGNAWVIHIARSTGGRTAPLGWVVPRIVADEAGMLERIVKIALFRTDLEGVGITRSGESTGAGCTF